VAGAGPAHPPRRLDIFTGAFGGVRQRRGHADRRDRDFVGPPGTPRLHLIDGLRVDIDTGEVSD
jgi:hypothetical protein